MVLLGLFGHKLRCENPALKFAFCRWDVGNGAALGRHALQHGQFVLGRGRNIAQETIARGR